MQELNFIKIKIMLQKKELDDLVHKSKKKNEYECGYRLNGDYIIFDSMKRLSKEKRKILYLLVMT